MINLNESRFFGINEEEDFVGFFIVSESLDENDGSFYTKKGEPELIFILKKMLEMSHIFI